MNDDNNVSHQQREIYNSTQQIVLAILPICSGLLSAFGSITIVYMILTEKKKKRSGVGGGDGVNNASSLSNDSGVRRSGRSARMDSYNTNQKFQLSTYQRIMIGLSVSDMLNSLRASTSTFPMPSDTIGVWQAHGTTTTCAIQGFFAQLGFASILYSASLAIYFIVSILPTIREDTIHHYIEPMLHTVPIVFAIGTAIIGLVLESYNPVALGIGCWVASYPWGCSDDNSTIECERGLNADTLLWLFGGIPVVVSYIIIIGCMAGIYISVRNQIKKMESRFMGTTSMSASGGGGGAAAAAGDSNRESTRTIQVTPTNNQALSRGSTERLKKIKTQALLYISIFFLTYIWPSIGRLMESDDNLDGVFIVSVCSQIFYPSQGLFNFFIYIRPRYIEIRTHHPNETWIRSIKIVLGLLPEPNRKLKRSTASQPSPSAMSSSQNCINLVHGNQRDDDLFRSSSISIDPSIPEGETIGVTGLGNLNFDDIDDDDKNNINTNDQIKIIVSMDMPT